MGKLNQFMLILFAVFCVMLATSNANARVCFAGGGDNDDCGSMNSFGDYTDPSIETADQCIKAGFPDKASNCRANPAKQITGYCPYNNDYVKCCGREYSYSNCIYPLKENGNCGNKYKCKCAPEYKYTMLSCRAEKPNSRASGASCVLSGFAAGAVTTEVYYTNCSCDRAIYPYTEKDCDKSASDVTGDKCTDSDGGIFYAACKCDENKFPIAVIDCEFGGGTEICSYGGLAFTDTCCSCDRYLAIGSANKPMDKKALTWETCNCPRRKGTRFKITSCADGYKPSSEGEACIRPTCYEAVNGYSYYNGVSTKKVKGFLETSPSYGIFNGSQVLDYSGNVSQATKAIVKSDMTSAGNYCYNVSSNPSLGCSKALTLLSPQEAAKSSSTDIAKAVVEVCTTNPTLTFTGRYFPYSNDSGTSTSTINFNGVNLKFSGRTKLEKGIYLTSGDLIVSSTIDVDRPLTVSGRLSGATNRVYGGGNLNIRSSYNSYRVGYDSLSNINVYRSASAYFSMLSSQELNAITLSTIGSVSFSGGKIYIKTTYVGFLGDDRQRATVIHLFSGAQYNLKGKNNSTYKVFWRLRDSAIEGTGGSIIRLNGVDYTKIAVNKAWEANEGADCSLDGNGGWATTHNPGDMEDGCYDDRDWSKKSPAYEMIR